MIEPPVSPSGLLRCRHVCQTEDEKGVCDEIEFPGRDYRAIGESGWDNTPRFGHDATQVIPVDLNCQLYRYELDLAGFSDRLGEKEKAAEWRARANKRRD